MITKKNTNLYLCSYCDKKYLYGKVCLRHEDRCSQNPKNENACFYCDHLVKKAVWSSDDHPYYRPEILCFTYECDKHKKQMYPRQKEYLKERFPESYEDKVSMPQRCFDYEPNGLEEEGKGYWDDKKGYVYKTTSKLVKEEDSHDCEYY